MTTPAKMQVALVFGNFGELRGTYHPEHGHVFSIKDYINQAKEKPFGSTYGKTAWHEMVNGKYKDEVAKCFVEMELPGIV